MRTVGPYLGSWYRNCASSSMISEEYPLFFWHVIDALALRFFLKNKYGNIHITDYGFL